MIDAMGSVGHPRYSVHKTPSFPLTVSESHTMILRSKLLRAALFAAAIGTTTAASATTTGPNYSDMWSNAQESGWGLTIDQQADVLLGTLFIYNKFELATWYTVQLRLDSIGPNGIPSYSGTIFETTGPALGKPYDQTLVKYRQVGTMNIQFGDVAHGLMTYTIDGAGAVKQISRLTFADNPIVGSYTGATSDITYDCKSPARNGIVTTDAGPFTITKEPDGYVLKFPTCTVTNGVYVQQGQIGQVDAIYTCPGVAGEIKFSSLQSEQSGILGTYTGRDASCSFRGNISGIRTPK